MEDLQQKTQHLTKFTLNICLSYGGRREILRACQSLCEEVKNGRLQLSDITEEKFSWALCSEGIPGIHPSPFPPSLLLISCTPLIF